jgi:Tol biopolymer transport system component
MRVAYCHHVLSPRWGCQHGRRICWASGGGGWRKIEIANENGGTAGGFHPSVSADGRYVEFSSLDRPVFGGYDVNNGSDVFVRDLQLGVTTLVSVGYNLQYATGNGASDNASISADGRYVAFESYASNLADALGGAPYLGCFHTGHAGRAMISTNTLTRLTWEGLYCRHEGTRSGHRVTRARRTIVWPAQPPFG